MNWKKSPFLFHMSKDISAKHICSNEALELTSRCALQDGDLCLFPSPGYFSSCFSIISVSSVPNCTVSARPGHLWPPLR